MARRSKGEKLVATGNQLLTKSWTCKSSTRQRNLLLSCLLFDSTDLPESKFSGVGFVQARIDWRGRMAATFRRSES